MENQENQNNFSLSACERALRKTGMRVNFKATRRFREIIGEYSDKITAKAAEAARHSKRMTIKTEDLDLAIKM